MKSARFSVASATLVFLLAAVALGQRPAADPNLLAAESYLRQQNYAKAREALDLVFRLDARPRPAAYLMLATCHFHLGAKEQAVEAVERGIAAHPAATDLVEHYIMLLPAAVGPEAARARLAARLREHPRSPAYRKALARLLLETEPAGAGTEAALAETARLLPRDAEAHFLYGQWACLNKRHELCIAELRQAQALAPANDEVRMQSYTLRAMAEEELGRGDRAEADFRAALAANRRLARPSPHAAFRYVEFLAQRNREAEAQRLVEEILKYAPDFGPAHFERAKRFARERRLEEALASGKLALEHLGGDQDRLRAVHAFMAKTYFAAGRPEEAKPHEEWIESHAKPGR